MTQQDERRVGRADRPRSEHPLATYHVLLGATLLLLVLGIRSGSTLYFEIALIIGLLGFVSTVALAKFLLRGEVIE